MLAAPGPGPPAAEAASEWADEERECARDEGRDMAAAGCSLPRAEESEVREVAATDCEGQRDACGCDARDEALAVRVDVGRPWLGSRAQHAQEQAARSKQHASHAATPPSSRTRRASHRDKASSCLPLQMPVSRLKSVKIQQTRLLSICISRERQDWRPCADSSA
jgi:hypothetical protein